MSETQIQLLKELIPLYGIKYTSEITKLSYNKIRYFCNKNNLSVKNKIIPNEKQKINTNQFNLITNPEVSYFLGFLWADGCIIQHKNLYRISLEINEEDGNNIRDIMNSLGKWSINVRKRKDKNWKPIMFFQTNNKELYKFLETFDYKNKSNCEPTKIIEHIPENLRLFFWRGYFDGDGTCGIYNSPIISWCSTYNYTFHELKNLLINLDIKSFFVKDYIEKNNNKCSKLKINGKNCLKICEYLLTSNIGLTRKTNKLTQIKQFLNKKDR